MSRRMNLTIDGTVRADVFERNSSNLLISTSITAMIPDWCNEVWGIVSRWECGKVYIPRGKHAKMLEEQMATHRPPGLDNVHVIRSSGGLYNAFKTKNGQWEAASWEYN